MVGKVVLLQGRILPEPRKLRRLHTCKDIWSTYIMPISCDSRVPLRFSFAEKFLFDNRAERPQNRERIIFEFYIVVDIKMLPRPCNLCKNQRKATEWSSPSNVEENNSKKTGLPCYFLSEEQKKGLKWKFNTKVTRRVTNTRMDSI